MCMITYRTEVDSASRTCHLIQVTMPSITSPLITWPSSGASMFEDVADRLNHVWTFGLLVIFASATSLRQLLHNPISCWLPNGFKEGNRQYINDVCWNSHVIVPPVYDSSKNHDVTDVAFYPVLRSSQLEIKNDTQIGASTTLYQWIPVIFAFQALLFKFPHLMLYMFHGYSGLSFDKLVSLTRGYDRLNIAERRILGNLIGRYVYNWCNQFGHCIPWRYLTLIYILTKFLFCVNVIVQMCLLDSFLKAPYTINSNFTSFSDVIIENIFRTDNAKWKSAPAFPRQVICDIKSSKLDIDDSRLHCVISINSSNEMLFVIIWVWFLFLSTLTCSSLVSCLLKLLIPSFRRRYILKSLNLADTKEDVQHHDSDFTKFADWVGEDGVMSLKLIGANSSEMLVSDIVCCMWKKRKRYKSSNKAGYIDMTSGSHASPPRIKIHPVVTEMDN